MINGGLVAFHIHIAQQHCTKDKGNHPGGDWDVRMVLAKQFGQVLGICLARNDELKFRRRDKHHCERKLVRTVQQNNTRW